MDPVSATNPEYVHESTNLRSKHDSIINFKKRPESKINISPSKEGGGKSNSEWKILSVKIVCVLFIVLAWVVAVAPYAGLVKYFLDPEVNTSDAVNIQTERIDNTCEIINNSTLGFHGNRSSNLSLECAYPYTSNGSLCVPLCGTWHPGGEVFHVVSRVVTCISAVFSLIGSLLGIVTWIRIGKKVFEFPQVIPFYLLICTSIQALCILIGQIHYEMFYCSELNLMGSRQHPTIQCSVQGAIFHYISIVFVFWYLSYVVSVLLILSFPFKLRVVGTNNWKLHLILFIVCTAVPLLILVIYWAVGNKLYEIVNHPVVCLPEPTLLVVTFVVPLSFMLGLSISSITLIISKLIINKVRIQNHKISTNPLTNEQNQFIFRTLGVTVIFTAINLFLSLEFGTRISSVNSYTSFVELYWACVTRYGTNTSCCVNDYIQFYKPELTVINDFVFCSWGLVALSTLAVKDARNFWTDLFKRCLCSLRKSAVPRHPEIGSSSTLPGIFQRKLTGVFLLRNISQSRESADEKKSDSGIEIETKPSIIANDDSF